MGNMFIFLMWIFVMFCTRLGTDYVDGFQVCNKALLDGATKLAADRFSASSFIYRAERSVLSDYGWCSDDRFLTNKNQWLQFDLVETKVITSIATAGSWLEHSWLKSYYVKYSFTGVTWSTYQEGGQDKLFTGNTDYYGVVTNSFKHFPVVARYIRINPQDWHYFGLCTKAELYGCTATVYPTFCGGFPLGIESKTIPDQSITASSFSPRFNTSDPADWFAPNKGRLNATSAWCAHKDHTNTDQWLQIDLGREVEVTGVASQGQDVRGVKTYYVKYSLDSATWSTYQENSSNKLLTGNTDSDTVVYNSLTSLQTRYIRFNPQSWLTGDALKICMRTEVYGCDVPATYSSCSEALVRTLSVNSFSASSSSSFKIFQPDHAQMTVDHAWCAHDTQHNMNQWLMVDLGELMIITKLETKGYSNRDVTSFFLEHSPDNSTWTLYQENNIDRIFLRKTEYSADVTSWTLKSSVIGRYVRFRPQTWQGNDNLCLKIEVYGCKFDISPVLVDKTLVKGGSVSLVCKVYGLVSPSMGWTKDNTALTDCTGVHKIQTTNFNANTGLRTSTLTITYTTALQIKDIFTAHCTYDSNTRIRTCWSTYKCSATFSTTSKTVTSSADVAASFDYLEERTVDIGYILFGIACVIIIILLGVIFFVLKVRRVNSNQSQANQDVYENNIEMIPPPCDDVDTGNHGNESHYMELDEQRRQQSVYQNIQKENERPK